MFSGSHGAGEKEQKEGIRKDVWSGVIELDSDLLVSDHDSNSKEK